MSGVERARWLPPLLVVAVLAGCSTSSDEPAPSPAPQTTTPTERQALAAYEEFWSVTDAAFAAPSARDWSPRLEQVATGQALDSLRRDVENYASVPAHTEGALTRAPTVVGSTDGRVDVVDCIDLGDFRLVSDTDGRVLNDLANRVPRYIYRAGLVFRDGRWLVNRTAPALDQPC